jgi:hypothetical protein
MCVASLDRITIRHRLYVGIWDYLLRNNMLIELNMLDMRGLPVNIDILLFGNDNLPVEFFFNVFVKQPKKFNQNLFHSENIFH